MARRSPENRNSASRSRRPRTGAAAGAALLAITLAGACAGLAAPGSEGVDLSRIPPAAARKVDFVRDIRPILNAKCVACHGPAKLMGGLRLHNRADALAGGDSGAAIVPGKGAESRLVHYVAGAVDGKLMPPAGERLSAEQVGLLRAWIDQGAEWPASADAETPRNPHWAFQPVKRPAVPAVKRKGWVTNPIDAFVLARLEQRGLRPSTPADRVTLLRRVSLDLTGIPPTPEEVDAFVNDRRPGAYERVVDRLLASPHYGERWGRHWLDLARYADSNGYTIDSPRQMWPYRDWVIRALNDDMPFDRFTVEQLAGDLLPNAGESQKIATGFHRNTLINEEGGTDPEQFRVEAVVDRANTTGAVWLGLTVGCAQCHTHKFDPITQKEYYRLFAFFNTQDEPTLAFPTPEQMRKQSELRAALAAAQRELTAYEKAHPQGENDPERLQLARRVNDLKREEKELAGEIPTAMVLAERKQPRETFVHLRGDFLRKGQPVQPGVPSVLSALQVDSPRPANRLDLARWLVSPENPLTSRVTVNRVWMRYFGTGLVETENDFGLQGTPPTHPELLDYLASVFATAGTSHVDDGETVETEGRRDRGKEGVRTAAYREAQPATRAQLSSSLRPSVSPSRGLGWSLKALHRLIVTSSTYRQASHAREDLAAKDPQNRLLGRQNRLRLDAEIIRDSALAASGLLSRKIGGPSVFPPQPAGTDGLTQVKRKWTVSKGEDRYRRGMYTWHWRSNQYALFATFDAPNGNTACTRRMRSNTPTQALMLANDEAFVEMAQALAARTLREAPATEDARLRYAFRRCLSREPLPEELQRLIRFLRLQVLRFRGAPGDAEAAAPKDRPEEMDTPTAAAWTAVARVLLNLDEFVTRE
ncbi:MAG: PSD1 and planctomycete cytochrome C domain-containing protein [Armatimonadota bacterium]